MAASQRLTCRLHCSPKPLSQTWQPRIAQRLAMRPYSSSESSLPRIASPSLWSSMVPKFLRRSGKGSIGQSKNFLSGEWNPATFFIIMSLLIGSNAIQMVSLKTRRLNYKRSTEAKLSLLREVIGRVQKGEDVDVEAMLGTGDPEREKEWEEVMKDLERDVDIWEKKSETHQEAHSQKGPSDSESPKAAKVDQGQRTHQPDQQRKPGFY
ncbi:hypothetical protein K461DRAFT_291711 [Myriangium duriaei CBS 260.36]|uniref:Uncharacterized protein n=1 Tax=Myriangium duriaei CBS 260.36 TaxID=1168546 RepID=A0A9P4MJ24_9PEZI|nr:hypothetical protein K461DRAFT_291711 [Myriangium duriaei CBS 260.36]